MGRYEKDMDLFIRCWLLIAFLSFYCEGQLLECALCKGKVPSECGNDPDSCDGHDRCSRMTYKDPNGKMDIEAGCSFEPKCGRKGGKIAMCQKKDACKVTMCCKDNLCNSPSIWLKSHKRLIIMTSLISFVIVFLLQ